MHIKASAGLNNNFFAKNTFHWFFKCFSFEEKFILEKKYTSLVEIAVAIEAHKSAPDWTEEVNLIDGRVNSDHASIHSEGLKDEEAALY